MKSLITTAKVGHPPTPESIRQGTVWMEFHPDYSAAIQKTLDAEFEIQKSGFACVDWIEIYDQNHNFLRLEKNVHVLENMRFLDLEHELGHIDQLSRFEPHVPPTEKLVELPDGRRYKYKIRDGILTVAQSTIVEYHNRLVEFIRLYERGVDVALLKEHASGVDFWHRKARKKGLKGERSPSKQAWADKYFGDIEELSKQYETMIQMMNRMAND